MSARLTPPPDPTVRSSAAPPLSSFRLPGRAAPSGRSRPQEYCPGHRDERERLRVRRRRSAGCSSDPRQEPPHRAEARPASGPTPQCRRPESCRWPRDAPLLRGQSSTMSEPGPSRTRASRSGLARYGPNMPHEHLLQAAMRGRASRRSPSLHAERERSWSLPEAARPCAGSPPALRRAWEGTWADEPRTNIPPRERVRDRRWPRAEEACRMFARVRVSTHTACTPAPTLATRSDAGGLGSARDWLLLLAVRRRSGLAPELMLQHV